MTFNIANVRQWMARQLRDDGAAYIDCAEVNATKLAEDCAAAFEVNDVPGPLDDDTHWIWTAAADAATAYERKALS